MNFGAEVAEERSEQIWRTYGKLLKESHSIIEAGERFKRHPGIAMNKVFWGAYYKVLPNVEKHFGELEYTEKKALGHALQRHFRYRVEEPKCAIDNLFDDIENFNNLTGEETMNPVEPKRASAICDDPAFEIRKLAFGRNIERMGADELIETVRRFEREIESLKAIKTESKHITKRITDLELGLKEVVQLLDSKE